MSNILFFPAISTLGYTAANNGQQLWRIGTKTTNTYNNVLTMELVFQYTDNPSTFNLSGSYMTLFNMGTDATTAGFSIVLFKNASTGKISLGVRYSIGTAWNDLVNGTTSASSFVSLDTITTSNTQGIYLMFQYSKNVIPNVINFYVKSFGQNANPAETGAPDFTFTFNSTQTGFPNVSPGTQWGFGSLPQPITYNNVSNPNGYNNDEGYNGYVSQNLSVFFLRTWSALVPVSSTGTTYGMFNTNNSAYSLYYLNQTFQYVPPLTPYATYKFDYQLFVPYPSTNIANLTNKYNFIKKRKKNI